MLGKLLKYEWKGLWAPFLIMLIVLGGTTALTCGVILTINPKYDEVVTGFSMLALILSVFLYYFGLIGCILGTLLIIVIRFYKTCYTDQGYLTHTLPVSTRQILNAKIIAAILADLLMLLAIAATIFIIIQVALHHISSLMPIDYREFSREFSSMLYDLKDELGISFGAYIAYIAIYSIIAALANIIILFGCVSLGQLYAKHRVAGAIIAYFVMLTVRQILGYICSIPMYVRMFLSTPVDSDITAFSLVSPSINLTLLLTILLAVAMYFINLHMMTKKLNLE